MVKDLMLEAVRTTMEEMFFLEVGEPNFQWARVAVEKPFEGAVTLAFPTPLIQDVASGLMPEESNPSEQMLQDMLAELVNTVAGRLMSSVVSKETTFTLRVPETGSGWPEPHRTPATVHPLQIDRKCFIVLLEGEALGSPGKASL